MNKYAGKICPFCKAEFKENDDIVICSSCDMPHHKDCWIENQGCTTFGCMGTIKAVDGKETSVTATEIKYDEPKNVSSVYCSKCGAKVSSDASFCCKCGAPLNSSVVNQPAYSAAATNHTYSTNTNQAYTEAHNYSTQRSNLYQSSQQNKSYTNIQGAGANYQNTYANPTFSNNTVIDSDIALLVGTNQEYYIPKFQMIKRLDKKTSWNWSAFFFSPFWFIYRKMYVYGVVILLVAFLVSLLDLFFLNLLVLGAYIILGVFANYIYMLRLEKHTAKVMLMNEPFKSQYIAKNGDVNTTALVFAISGYVILAGLVALI